VRGFRYSEPDLRVYTLFRMLQELSVDRRLYAQLFGVDPVEEHAPVWEAFAERGWVIVEDERISVVGDGGFYTPLIQGLVASARLEAMRRARRGGQPSRLEAATAEVAP
jgi:oxygen-independent coproporphyrinogen-3 oxidase